jgi:ATP-dependent DNA helicase RecG
MIEKIGRGTLKMIEDCENKGYPMPIWISKSGVTKLYFPAVTITAKTDETANNTLDDISIEAIGECFTGSVKKRLIAIVSFVRRHKHTKVTDLMKEFNVSERTIKSNLKKLIDAGLIVYIGSKKTGAYSVIIKTTDNIQP